MKKSLFIIGLATISLSISSCSLIHDLSYEVLLSISNEISEKIQTSKYGIGIEKGTFTYKYRSSEYTSSYPSRSSRVNVNGYYEFDLANNFIKMYEEREVEKKFGEDTTNNKYVTTNLIEEKEDLLTFTYIKTCNEEEVESDYRTFDLKDTEQVFTILKEGISYYKDFLNSRLDEVKDAVLRYKESEDVTIPQNSSSKEEFTSERSGHLKYEVDKSTTYSDAVYAKTIEFKNYNFSYYKTQDDSPLTGHSSYFSGEYQFLP